MSNLSLISQVKVQNLLQQKIAEYEKKTKNVTIAYGGDGTILDVVRQTKGDKAVIPIRNYGLCKKHSDYLMSILDGTSDEKLKLTLCQFIEYNFSVAAAKDRGIAEIVVKNIDPTCALRFNLYVGEKAYMKNVVADGIIMSTAYGSTGYFKSVARCIFNMDAIGIAFIAPTQGINNVIVDSTKKIRVEFIRSADIIVTADKAKTTLAVKANDSIDIERVPEQVSIFGLDEFHCQECRTLRHSIIEDGVAVQDQYAV